MLSDDDLVEILRRFVIDAFLPGERPENLPADLDLIQSGVLDSLALIETASYLADLTGTEIEGYELTPENLGSLAAMAAFVRRRRAST